MYAKNADLFINGQSFKGDQISNININTDSVATLVMRLYFVIHTYLNITVDYNVEGRQETLFGNKVFEKNLATRQSHLITIDKKVFEI
jgi:hypothetical protein